MNYRNLLPVVAVVLVASARAETTADRWDLSEIYPSVAAWKADADKVDAQLKSLAGCKGHLGSSAARLKQCLDLQADITKRYYRLAVYAGEQAAEDTGNPTYLELDQKADVIGTRVAEAGAFVDPEILHIGKARIAQLLKQEPSLSIYRFPLARIARMAPHTLNDEGEALLATLGLMDNAGGSAYTILTNADIPWPKIKLSTGEQITLNASAYTKYREAPNREDRKQVMDAFFATFKTYERTIGVNLYSQLKQNAVHAKVRKYPDSIARALDANNVPVAVLRHADRADRGEPADAVSLFPPAGEAAGRAAAALLRHLSAARAQRRQAALRRRPRARAGSGSAARQGLRRRHDLWIRSPLDGHVPAPAQAVRRPRRRLCIRRASVRADELQRRLRVGHHAGARVGARHALVPGQQDPAIRRLHTMRHSSPKSRRRSTRSSCCSAC